jgi:phage gpG-like protein
MFKSFDVKFDVSEVANKLNIAQKDQKKMIKKGLGKIGVLIRKIARSMLSGRVLKKRTGKLYSSIYYKAGNDLGLMVGSKMYYGVFHERGAKILPKKKKSLSFNIGGKWIKTKKEVVLPKKEFLIPAVNEYFNGNKGMEILDKSLQEQLDKIVAKSTYKSG